jgi:hypothetical protein
MFTGTLLPDLIDKPLYYGSVILFGSDATKQSLISGTRTFGHTLLLLLILISIAYLRKSRVFAALAAGMATHLLLDNAGDYIAHALGFLQTISEPNGLHALFWPLLGLQFPVYGFASPLSHLASLSDPWILFGEVTGLIILFWDFYYRRPAISFPS